MIQGGAFSNADATTNDNDANARTDDKDTDEQKTADAAKHALDKIKTEFDTLISQCWDTTFVLVTNELGSGTHAATHITRKFVDAQGWFNQHVASQAQRVIYMVCGVPNIIKDQVAATTVDKDSCSMISKECHEEAKMLDKFLSTQKLQMGEKGYFLIKVDRIKGVIVVSFHSCILNDKGEACDLDGNKIPCHGKSPEPIKVWECRTAKELTTEIFERWSLSRKLDISVGHAAYIGREAQKAEYCLYSSGTHYQRAKKKQNESIAIMSANNNNNLTFEQRKELLAIEHKQKLELEAVGGLRDVVKSGVACAEAAKKTAEANEQNSKAFGEAAKKTAEANEENSKAIASRAPIENMITALLSGLLGASSTAVPSSTSTASLTAVSSNLTSSSSDNTVPSSTERAASSTNNAVPSSTESNNSFPANFPFEWRNQEYNTLFSNLYNSLAMGEQNDFKLYVLTSFFGLSAYYYPQELKAFIEGFLNNAEFQSILCWFADAAQINKVGISAETIAVFFNSKYVPYFNQGRLVHCRYRTADNKVVLKDGIVQGPIRQNEKSNVRDLVCDVKVEGTMHEVPFHLLQLHPTQKAGNGFPLIML